MVSLHDISAWRTALGGGAPLIVDAPEESLKKDGIPSFLMTHLVNQKQDSVSHTMNFDGTTQTPDQQAT